MTTWRAFLNDKIPDCGVAACGHAIQLWTGKAPSDADIQIAQDRFSALEDWAKPLRGWFCRGIGGNKLGGFARIRPNQIGAAIKRFGCAYVCLSAFEGSRDHAVLVIADGAIVSWGKEYPGPPLLANVLEAYAIAEHWHPVLLWWTLRNWGL